MHSKPLENPAHRSPDFSRLCDCSVARDWPQSLPWSRPLAGFRLAEACAAPPPQLEPSVSSMAAAGAAATDLGAVAHALRPAIHGLGGRNEGVGIVGRRRSSGRGSGAVSDRIPSALGPGVSHGGPYERGPRASATGLPGSASGVGLAPAPTSGVSVRTSVPPYLQRWSEASAPPSFLLPWPSCWGCRSGGRPRRPTGPRCPTPRSVG